MYLSLLGGIIVSHIDLLKQTGLFDGLGVDDLKKIEKGCVEQAYPMGTVIIQENDAPKEMLFIIKSGEIVIATSAPTIDAETEGTESFLTTLGPGDAFGEISLIDRNPHSAKVQTISDSILLLLSGKYFFSLVENDKNIGFVVVTNIAKVICQRLRSSNFSAKHFGMFGKLGPC